MFGASHKHEHLKGLIGQGGPLRLKDVLALAEGACVIVMQLPPRLPPSCRPLPATPWPL